MHTFTDPDLIELDRIWPLGQQLVVPENGTIVVAGVYRGRYVHYLSARFPAATIFGYEPQQSAFEICQLRFADNPKVLLSPNGLATSPRLVGILNYGTDGASVVGSGERYETGKLEDVVQLLNYGSNTDLLLLNCEGSEWALLPYLLDEMVHHRIASMAIQFHPEYVSPQRAERVKEYLLEYYTREYSDTNNWTYWKRKAA